MGSAPGIRPVLRVAVVGTGAFGKNHLRVYRELETAGLGVALTAAVEPDPARASETAARYAIPVFATVDELLAATLAEADDLIARAARGKRILQPGHLERFNPAVLAIELQLRRPMFFESHRLSVFTPRALDVDVVLDLMIHDLDIVLTLAASPAPPPPPSPYAVPLSIASSTGTASAGPIDGIPR